MTALPNSRFVNQHGAAWTAAQSSGENSVDAVWNPTVRTAQADYLALLAARLGATGADAIRVGGLATGELHYPSKDFAGESDCWWGFSASAQAASNASDSTTPSGK